MTEAVRDFSDIAVDQGQSSKQPPEIKPIMKPTKGAKSAYRKRRESSSSDSEPEESSVSKPEALSAVNVKVEKEEHVRADSAKESEQPSKSVDAKPEIKQEAPEASQAPEVEPPKPKVDRLELIKIKFQKRTVGEVFDAARERYLERKRIRYG